MIRSRTECEDRGVRSHGDGRADWDVRHEGDGVRLAARSGAGARVRGGPGRRRDRGASDRGRHTGRAGGGGRGCVARDAAGSGGPRGGGHGDGGGCRGRCGGAARGGPGGRGARGGRERRVLDRGAGHSELADRAPEADRVDDGVGGRVAVRWRKRCDDYLQRGGHRGGQPGLAADPGERGGRGGRDGQGARRDACHPSKGAAADRGLDVRGDDARGECGARTTGRAGL